MNWRRARRRCAGATCSASIISECSWTGCARRRSIWRSRSAICAARVVPRGTFAELPMPLLVNTVDLERGAPLIWGTARPPRRHVQDAVYASCALPGFFPPGRVGDRLCVDGGVIDNLPVAIAALSADLIIAVDVGSTDLRPITDAMALGFANIYMRAATTMMHALQQFPLTHWHGPPMVLIRPRCGEDWLSFGNIGDDDSRRPSRRAQGARGHRRVLRPAGRRLSAPAFRDRGRSRQVHRLRTVRLARAEPHGPRRRGQSVHAHAHRRLVASRRRFRRSTVRRTRSWRGRSSGSFR